MVLWLLSKNRFPAILVFRRYLKLTARWCEDANMMDTPRSDIPDDDLPFDKRSLRIEWPKHSVHRLWPDPPKALSDRSGRCRSNDSSPQPAVQIRDRKPWRTAAVFSSVSTLDWRMSANSLTRGDRTVHRVYSRCIGRIRWSEVRRMCALITLPGGRKFQYEWPGIRIVSCSTVGERF